MTHCVLPFILFVFFLSFIPIPAHGSWRSDNRRSSGLRSVAVLLRHHAFFAASFFCNLLQVCFHRSSQRRCLRLCYRTSALLAMSGTRTAQASSNMLWRCHWSVGYAGFSCRALSLVLTAVVALAVRSLGQQCFLSPRRYISFSFLWLIFVILILAIVHLGHLVS